MRTVKDLLKIADDDKKPSLARGAALGTGLAAIPAAAIHEKAEGAVRAHLSARLAESARSKAMARKMRGPDRAIYEVLNGASEAIPDFRGIVEHGSALKKSLPLLAAGALGGVGVQAFRRRHKEKTAAPLSDPKEQKIPTMGPGAEPIPTLPGAGRGMDEVKKQKPTTSEWQRMGLSKMPGNG